ncbi:hypothetical protein R9X47_04970 [Wukongibacter baidiensis]|uniref:uridine kinase family protein n=1 Tax=Wukongibacter baidiensis TaxID=1723361 RepID=UPI003D7F4926
MKFKYKDLAIFLEKKLKEKDFIIISIDGPGGSGKSFFTDSLCRHLSNSQIIHFDDFYFEKNNENHNNLEIGSSFDWSRLEREVLTPLRKGSITFYQKYDWLKDEVSGKYEVKPEGIILIEGIYSGRKEIRDYYDLNIWVEADYDLRLKRGIDRDGEDMKDKWVDEWMPKENEYISSEFHNTCENADIIICGETNNMSKYDCLNIVKTKIDFITKTS